MSVIESFHYTGIYGVDMQSIQKKFIESEAEMAQKRIDSMVTQQMDRSIPRDNVEKNHTSSSL